MIEPFDENARVHDEHHDYHGRAAIRAWIDDAVRTYNFSFDVKDVLGHNGRAVVSALVAGMSPGSLPMLRHPFSLPNSKITGLEIGG